MLLVLFTGTAILSEENHAQAIRGLSDTIRMLRYDLDQVRAIRKQLNTEVLGATVPKKQIKGIPTLPILADTDLKRINKQRTLNRSLAQAHSQQRSTNSQRSAYRGGRGRGFFRKKGSGNNARSSSSDTPSGPNPPPSAPSKRGGRH